MTKDPRKTGYAQSATDSIRIRRAKKRVKHGDIVSDTHDEIELRELDLKKAEVEAEISRVKTGAEAAKPQTIRERLRSKVQDKTELDDAVRELKREIDREFPDDPVERERRYAEVDAAARDFI